MNIAPNVECTFEVTFDSPSLSVAMSVYDTSGISPVLVSGPAAMTSVVGNTYIGKFTPVNPKEYLIFKAVYTDGTLTTLSPDYSQSSESIIAQTTGSVVTTNNYFGNNTTLSTQDTTNTTLDTQDTTNSVMLQEDTTNTVLYSEGC